MPMQIFRPFFKEKDEGMKLKAESWKAESLPAVSLAGWKVKDEWRTSNEKDLTQAQREKSWKLEA